jgi:hypothetical protein
MDSSAFIGLAVTLAFLPFGGVTWICFVRKIYAIEEKANTVGPSFR